MNEEVKRRWVEALRSGEYEQGQQYLHWVNQGGEWFCCLGVLCDLAFKDGAVQRHRTEGEGGFRYGSGEQSSVLPDEVMDWADLDRDNPEVGSGPTGGYALAWLNDEGNAPFAKIADLIEEWL